MAKYSYGKRVEVSFEEALEKVKEELDEIAQEIETKMKRALDRV